MYENIYVFIKKKLKCLVFKIKNNGKVSSIKFSFKELTLHSKRSFFKTLTDQKL